MLLDELGAYLQTAGIGTLGQSLFKGMLPLDTPGTTHEAITAILEVPGSGPTYAHDGTKYEQPHVQIICRGSSYAYALARQKSQAAWDALDNLANQTLNGVFYLRIQALQSPFYLRIDEHNRPHIVFTVRCQRAL